MKTPKLLVNASNHSNKEYYENMVIEQYTKQLDFQISIGVRLARPTTLELAIVVTRQEEVKLTYNRFLGFLPKFSHTGENLEKVMLEFLNKLDLDITYYRGQSNNNAFNISGGLAKCHF